MSIYNEPIDWLSKSIDSILTQTFSDFEFIIVNDKPDRKENELLLKEYCNKDNRIVVLTNESNIGLTKSLNKALDLAKGEYVARMDADDISLPERFMKQITLMNNHPEICVVGSWTSLINEQGDCIVDVVKYESNPHWVRALFLTNSQIAHPAAMFRRIVNHTPVKYDESFKFAQDYSLWVNLLSYGDITNMPEVLFLYRISNDRITANKKLEQQFWAGVAQRKAFTLFDFPIIDSFLDVFYKISIQQQSTLPVRLVKSEFIPFFLKAHKNDKNAFALEVISGQYINYLRNSCGGKAIRFVSSIINNCTIVMVLYGCRYLCHHMARKHL